LATIENVKLVIGTAERVAGYSDIMYTYDLNPSSEDRSEGREYRVTVDIWGEDTLDDDLLATDRDPHRVRCEPDGQGPIKVERSFQVETKVLHEDLFGDDEVFLIVEARFQPDEGEPIRSRASGRSNTVIGRF
jgi:hypothetical protein